MDTQQQSIIDRIRQANSILVTVSANPTVDQLAACVGLTIMLNSLEKRATAVFSGEVPSTLEFLQPENTIEKNTDSLQDFIIALDKSKADKLRYKVEDQVVKIFITPYRTSIGQNDLEFSKGDFNVEVVICLGVQDQKDLDQAITAHGRILHDATVISINTQGNSTLGTLNWQNPQASSLSEMVTSLVDGFGAKLDPQIATALLTGVVAETDRFSNSKTSPQTMQVSAMLMAAGANQQLVATKLQTPVSIPPKTQSNNTASPNENTSSEPEPPAATTSGDGTLSIAHENDETPVKKPPIEKPKEVQEAEEPKVPEAKKEESVSLPPVQPPEQETPPPPKEASEKAEELPEPIHINTVGPATRVETEDRPFLPGRGPTGVGDETPPSQDEQAAGVPNATPSFVLTPPSLGGVLTANSRPEGLDPSTDPLSNISSTMPPILTHNSTAAGDDQAKAARYAVADARSSGPNTERPTPRMDLSTQQLTGELHDDTQKAEEPAKLTEPMGSIIEPLAAGANEPAPAADSPSARPMDMPLPAPTGPLAPPIEPLTSTAAPAATMPTTPPPTVPPPFMPQPIIPNGQ